MSPEDFSLCLMSVCWSGVILALIAGPDWMIFAAGIFSVLAAAFLIWRHP